MTNRRYVASIAALAAAIVASAPAFAGTYDVPACDAAGGVNNSWVPYSNNPYAPAYTACPSGGDPSRGMVARNAVGGTGARVPAGTISRVMFTAPPSTSIIGIRASYRFSKTDAPWEAALSTGSQILAGCSPGPFGCATSATDTYIPVPNSPYLYIDAYCAYTSCLIDSTGDPGHNYLEATANLYSAVVRVQDDVGPSVGGQRGSLLASGWHGGSQTAGLDAADSTGIAETRVLIDGTVVARSVKSCDYTLPVPCQQASDGFTVGTTTIRPDGPHAVTLQAVDAAGNVSQASHGTLIDNTAPLPPGQLRVDGGEGWRSTNAFSVVWQNQADSGSPVAGAEYELCPSGGQSCQRGHVDGPDLTTIPAIRTPAAGDYVLKVWLRDAAGNQDQRTAAPPVHLRYDDEPPAAAFAPVDPANPTQVAVAVTDHVSGLGGGTIEVKSDRGTAWRALPSAVDNGRLVADLDDEHLHDGVYDLRARVTDQAGNERTTEQRADGTPARLTLPLRLKTKLRVGAMRRSHHRGERARAALRRHLHVSFGRRVRLRGRLTTADGSAFADAEVLVLRQLELPGAAPTPVATLRTSRTGRFSYLAPKGINRRIVFRYAGTHTIRAVTRTVEIGVRARSTFHPLRGSYINGESIRFRGRINGGHLPRTGKLVELQVRLRGTWRTFVTVHANRRGRWQYRYPFTGTRGHQTYRFRALIPREADWPFDRGVSRRSRVVVRGL